MSNLVSRLDRIEKALSPKSCTGRTYEQLDPWEKALWFIGNTQWTALTEEGMKLHRKLFKEMGYEPATAELFNPECRKSILDKARQRKFSFLERYKEDIEQASNITEVLQYLQPECRDNLQEFLTQRYRWMDDRLYGRMSKSKGDDCNE
jgi:hypothetical protein